MQNTYEAAGPTTCARARAAGDDDVSDYDKSFSGMRTPHSGRRSGAHSGHMSCSSLQDSQPHAQRIDMDMLTQQIGVLRIGHEAMQNTTTQTQQALLDLQVQQNIGWNRMYAHYQRPLPQNITFIPMPPQWQQDPSPQYPPPY